jgi:hypothetical protein
MVATSLKAWGIGFVVSVALFFIGDVGTHTPLQFAFLFILPFSLIAAEIARSAGANPPSEMLTKTLTPLFSGGFYGMIVFLILRRRSRRAGTGKQSVPYRFLRR